MLMRAAWLVLLIFPLVPVAAAQAQGSPPTPTITVQSSLVLVPALVKTKAGELVFSLTSDEFVLTDDGVPQPLRLEPDTDSQPLALLVLVQTGGAGVNHLADYRGLDAVLDAIVGNVQHRIAVVSFDSAPHLEQVFRANADTAADTLNQLEPGDRGAAILDGLLFAVDLLRKQATTYRRAILMLSETVDSGSQTGLDETLRAVDDTNTAIYSFAFPVRGAQRSTKLRNCRSRTIVRCIPLHRTRRAAA